MRVLHISDMHGYLQPLQGKFDIVVASGDLSPNFTYDQYEIVMQMNWWENKMPDIKRWLDGKPFLFILGNHDYFDGFELEKLLNRHGVIARCLHDKITNFAGLNFYGFPYVPPINGKFAFESSADEMSAHIDKMKDAVNNTYVDVIVAHCPPAGILSGDFDQGKCFGNTQMTTALYYQISKDMMPAYYLTGHIHSRYGVQMKDGVLYSNAATTQQIIEM